MNEVLGERWREIDFIKIGSTKKSDFIAKRIFLIK